MKLLVKHGNTGMGAEYIGEQCRARTRCAHHNETRRT